MAPEQAMDLSIIHDTFRSWVLSLRKQGLEACFAHGLETEREGQMVVSAVLLTAMPDPKRRAQGSPRRRPSSLPLARLRYLIAVGGFSQGLETEQTLLELMVMAQNTPGITLLGEAPSASWWLACGVAPRPAFVLEAGVSEAVERQTAKPVRELHIDLGGMHSVHGRVVAADETPIAGAEIQIIATGQVVRSDHHGSFRLQVGALTPGRHHGRVRVRARGVEQRFDIPGPTTAQRPWLIRMEQLGA